MEEQRAPDRRVLRTKRAIRNAFAQLLTEKDVNAITIRDIADRADINRNTFYRYYAGVYELINEIENDLVAQFDRVLEESRAEWSWDDPYVFFEKLTAIIHTDLDFYGHLLSMTSNASLLSKIGELSRKKTKEAILAAYTLDEEKLDLLLDYTSAGMLAVYQRWFTGSRRSSIEELSRTVSELCVHGLNGLFPNAEQKKKPVL